MIKNYFHRLIELSKKTSSSLLKDETPIDLEQSDLFNNEDKEYIHKNLTDKTLIKERRNLSNQINIQDDWNIIKNKTQTPVKKIVFWRYAAALIVIGTFISIGFFYEKSPTHPIIEAPSVTESIGVGTDKATLTLENGTNIQLEKGKTIHSNSISCDGQKLIYQNTSKHKTEIQYNYLTIPRGGQYFIKLADGTEVWLNSESQLKYPVAFIQGETRQVELIYGEAYFSVSPSTKHNGDKFKVINQAQDIEVIGTEFNVKAYKDEAYIYTTLVEGKVDVWNTLANKQTLAPNQQSIVDVKNNTTIEVNEVDVKIETSWKNGLFSFKGKKLKHIMKVISRWYDVDVVFENKTLEDVTFKGVLGKDQKIENILLSIKALSVIDNYEITGKTIVLH
ncbi:FecR family protein [Algibacter miyuki]|uniref:FecR family protein n=1 Tax=Algibacter miyuki TaxID=1306933 RepID=A0ABV5GXS0_9FLAO|nr:FecR family protein [Algibacter miyuki]MDN3665164.1 FecR family protein [Algibacter miyuki]